jgi:hypothetical protein
MTEPAERFHGLTIGAWCDLARRRQKVHVFYQGAVHECTLIAWRPIRPGRTVRTKTARVEFPSGSRATVKIGQVTPIHATAD